MAANRVGGRIPHLTIDNGNRFENISSVLGRPAHSRLPEMPEEAEARSRPALARKAEEDRQALQQRASCPTAACHQRSVYGSVPEGRGDGLLPNSRSEPLVDHAQRRGSATALLPEIGYTALGERSVCSQRMRYPAIYWARSNLSAFPFSAKISGVAKLEL